MKVLVVAATLEEIKPSLTFLSEKGIEYLITGVGMVATSYSLTKRLQQSRVDLLVHVGIGGILDTSANLGEVYRIFSDDIFELGADDNGTFISIEQLGFGKRKYAERPPTSFSLPAVRSARGITVNNVHGSHDRISTLHKHYPKTLIESMEGAATFFVAEQEEIYCLQFRAVSNYIEPRNREGWEIGLAVQNLNAFLKTLF